MAALREYADPPHEASWQVVIFHMNLGRVAEHFARYYFSSIGVDVFTPESESSCDLIVDLASKLLRVQVKSSSHRVNKHASFTLVRTRFNRSAVRRSLYSQEECDLFFLMDDEKNAWLIEFNDLRGIGRVTPAGRFERCQIAFQGRVAQRQRQRI